LTIFKGTGKAKRTRALKNLRKIFVFGSLFLWLCSFAGKSRMIMQKLQHFSLAWMRSSVTAPLGFQNIRYQKRLSRPFKMSRSFSDENINPAAFIPAALQY
jgi:hypothetical protein